MSVLHPTGSGSHAYCSTGGRVPEVPGSYCPTGVGSGAGSQTDAPPHRGPFDAEEC